MSLQKLRDDLITQADSQKAITLNAATITGAGLTPPPDLDSMIAKGLSVPKGKVLLIATTRAQIGAVSGNTLSLTGKLAVFAETKQRDVRVDFTATGPALNFVLTVTLDGGWQFGDSFIYMRGNLFKNLPLDPGVKAPTFVFSTSAVPNYRWGSGAQDVIALRPGLNFAGYLTLEKLLSQIAPLLPSLSGAKAFLLSGSLDPSRITAKGQTPAVLFPGMDLKAPLADATYNLEFLTVSKPTIALGLLKTGTDPAPKLTPQVALSLGLDAGIGNPIVFQAGIPVDGGSLNLTVLPESGGALLTAAQLFKLMAGQTWYLSLPPQVVGFLSHFQFQSFSAWFLLGAKPQLTMVSCRVGSGPIEWKLFDIFQLNALSVDWSVSDPLGEPESSVTISAEFMFFQRVFTSPFFVTIDDDLTVSGRYPGTVSLSDVVSGLTGGAVAVPSWFKLSFSDIAVTVSPAQRSYSLQLGAELSLDVFNNQKFALQQAQFSLSAVKAGETAPYAYSFSFSGLLVLGPVLLLVSADYSDQEWTLAAAMPFGTELSLQDLIDSIFESVQLPQDLFRIGLSISDLSLSAVIGT